MALKVANSYDRQLLIIIRAYSKDYNNESYRRLIQYLYLEVACIIQIDLPPREHQKEHKSVNFN